MTRRARIDDLNGLAVPSQPALSADGAQVAYVLRTLDVERDRNVDELWLVAAGGGTPRRLTLGPADTAPAWSPDGRRLAFVRDGRLAVVPADGGEVELLTGCPPGAGAPRWSPDGRRLAFTAPVGPAGGTDAPLVLDRLDYQADGAGLHGGVRSQLHVLDLTSRRVRRLTDGPDSAGEPAWSPDGTTLAFPRRSGADSDLTCRTPVFLLAVDQPGAAPRQVALADGVAGTVEWTPDGAGLLVTGWLGDPAGHARLLRVRLADGEVTDLSGHLDRNVLPGATGYPGGPPAQAGDRVLFCLRDRGCTHLWSVGTEGSGARPVLDGAGRVVSGLAVAADRAAVALRTPSSYGEIVVIDLASGRERVLTSHGAALDDVLLYPREERTFRISDGTEVQAWLVHDPGRSGARPVLLDVHGGPHNAWNGAADEVHLYHQELVARGWAVLLVNPRGSDGYGERFYRGVHGAWGVADAADFLEPLDQLVAEGLADPDRLAVTGYSYGGFMTCWLTGHDDRFAAAVAGGPVSDLVSMSGTSDDAPLLNAFELGGAPWQRPEQFAAMSPLTHVGNVRTPTLVLHGQADLTCPLGQAQQWHSALREQGVPTRLVVYPGASHVFVLTGRPAHRLDYNRRVLDWVERHTRQDGRPPVDLGHWERRLAELAERHGVPGAQLGILRLDPGAERGDEVWCATHGVLNVRTGAPVRADSLFQIGSITKVWTATVAMALVDEGLLQLDTPVAEVLPELRLADPDVTKSVTLRHLLTHTSGIDGDIFTDTGRGDDCLEKYVAGLGEAEQNHPLGATWSYCNSGFSLVGRMIEKVTGTTWDEALRDRLFSPLGLAHTVTLPEDALLFGAAVGHDERDGRTVPAAAWTLPRSIGPAGLVTSAVADVLAFARMHLTGGVAADGTRVLSERSVDAMAAMQAELPVKLSLGDSWGLGWIRFGWGEHRLIGHDGNTLGQAAFLRLLPEQGLAVALLTNGGRTRDLYEELYREIFAELAGADMPAPFAPPAEPVPVDVTPHVGTYERASVRQEVEDTPGGPVLRTVITGPLAELVPDPVEEYPMTPVAPGVFAVRPGDGQTWTPVTFYELSGGERYLHFGVRATPKVR
ncbi:dipeptidyl aminopeptidase/acylaminoacyl peptidase [Prauserella shujinwangii]|uniref:Dipeptidyl aminopeptidase/acylaminoacyl peptidase n=1 Tax=Prauserella shujinwangii TaxID=1453103 RepID=A0A2T0LT51_9PSEU|nr:serine hydrolase [Prauserella shujinwangii]PRX46909.1 dipeptidyl aminopeptidase/acylaminoacyl peptidase [Prauserella shujinwangii]